MNNIKKRAGRNFMEKMKNDRLSIRINGGRIYWLGVGVCNNDFCMVAMQYCTSKQ